MKPSECKPLRLWRAISRIPSLRAPMLLWRAELGEHWADCQTLLTATPELAAWTLASDGVTPCDLVMHRDGSMVGIDCLAGEVFAVNRDTQIVCKLNLRSLAAKITETLEGRIDFNLNSPDANVHRIRRLSPKLASAAMHLCVRGNDESLLATASSLASSTFVVVLAPTLLHASIDVDALMVTVKRKLNVSIASRGRIAIRPHDPNAEPPRSRPNNRTPRISKLMALAIRFDEMLRTGEASDTIELARRGHVTQPRMSQIMALNQLAPDIQEALLNLPATKGKPEIHEKRLRPIAAMLNWDEQRKVSRELSCFTSTDAEIV